MGGYGFACISHGLMFGPPHSVDVGLERGRRGRGVNRSWRMQKRFGF